MAYKYNSALKHFTYSKESYQVISDFLLSGDITNPNILLKVNEVTKTFKPTAKSRDWFRLSTTKSYISALINIKLETGDKKLKTIVQKWIKAENIDKKVFLSEWVADPLTQDSKENRVLNLDFLSKTEDNKLIKLLKDVGLVSVKKGNLKGSENGKSVQGTWIHKDLAVKYAEWLDPRFSIWVSQKIQELISDGVAWNEIRATTKMDYKPLILAIEKYVMPKYPNMDENIIKGQIANYINLRVMGQKAKEIRAEKQIEDDELTRDYFKKLQLKQIEEVQVFAKTLIVQLDICDFKTLEDKISKYKF